MPVFYCKVVDDKGKTAEFIRETSSEEILIRELSADRLFPIVIERAGTREVKAKGKKRYPKNLIIEFTDTLALLLSSGLIFKEALEVAQAVFQKGRLNRLAATLLDKIKKGISFHEALEEFGSSFPPLYRGMVKVGEKVGSLEQAFKGLSLYLTEEKKLKEKFIGSLMYPAMVLSVAFVGIFILIFFILPRIKGIFTQLGSQLPQRIESITRVLNVLIIAGVAGVVFLLVLFAAVYLIRKTGGSMAERLDRLILRVPVLGHIRSLRESLNFLFAMETLTGAGFAVEDALLEAGNVVENRALRSGIFTVRDKILRGEALSAAFMENAVFPERLSRWVHVGEKSGNIEKAFAQLRSYYQGEVERWSTRFMNLIEPVLILMVGAIIFLFIIFFVMPIFTIYGSL
jgi:type II secretory pathway component PulF